MPNRNFLAFIVSEISYQKIKSPCQPPVLKVCQDIAQRIKKDNKNEIENVLINGSDVISTNSTKHMQLILTLLFVCKNYSETGGQFQRKKYL